MISIATITAITPVRWYNNTVCQDREPAPTTLPTEFFACFTDDTFLFNTNIYEWDVSPTSAGNMVDNNFNRNTILLTTLSAPALAETYTATVTTGLGAVVYTTNTTAAVQTTDEIGLDLANKINANPRVSARYINARNSIVIESISTTFTLSSAFSPITAGQSTRFDNPVPDLITRSGTMAWDHSFTGSATIRVRSLGCGATPSPWTSVVIDVVEERVLPIVVSDLYEPLVLNADTCGGRSTGEIPVCQVDALTLPTQFFTSSINASNTVYSLLS